MEHDQIRTASQWSATIHIVGFSIFTAGIGLSALFLELEFNPAILLRIVMPVALTVNILWLFLIKKVPEHISSLYFFIALNLIIVTSIVYFSGGPDSPFPFLYLISIISAALISFRATLGASIISLLLLLAVLFTTSPTDITTQTLIRVMRLVVLATIVVFQSYYLISRIKKVDQELLDLKDQFIFRIVHDIRSPIVSIRWLIDKYQMPAFKKKYPEIQEDVQFVEDSAKRVLSISEQLLNLAKGKRETVPLESISLVAIIEEVLKEMQPGIAEKNIHVEYDGSQKIDPVSANYELLQEAFSNVIGNGIKYNKQDGTLSISHSKEGNLIKTRIQNTGPKIAFEALGSLFTPYFRGDMEKRISGTGLGLFITKEITERFGGSVGVESSTDEATVFFISLPMAKK